MALPLGKLTILVGAGILGSVLAKEGHLPSLSDVFSGALKVVLKPITQDDAASSATKPRNDALVAQVNNLRQELQLLASSRPVTIMTSSANGGHRYGVIIVIAATGYGYMWWKGWKLPDFMFTTKRSLSENCNSVAKQLEQVYSSIMDTKKALSSKLAESSGKYDDLVICSARSKDEVAIVRREASKFTMDLQSVNQKIQTLENKMGIFQGKLDETKEGVGRLLLSTVDAGNGFTDVIQKSPSSLSMPALECSRVAVASRTVSLPPYLSAEHSFSSYSDRSTEAECSSSSSSDESTEGYQGISEDYITNHTVSNGNRSSEISEKPPGPESLQTLPIRSPGLLSRTVSVAQYFKYAKLP